LAAQLPAHRQRATEEVPRDVVEEFCADKGSDTFFKAEVPMSSSPCDPPAVIPPCNPPSVVPPDSPTLLTRPNRLMHGIETLFATITAPAKNLHGLTAFYYSAMFVLAFFTVGTTLFVLWHGNIIRQTESQRARELKTMEITDNFTERFTNLKETVCPASEKKAADRPDGRRFLRGEAGRCGRRTSGPPGTCPETAVPAL